MLDRQSLRRSAVAVIAQAVHAAQQDWKVSAEDTFIEHHVLQQSSTGASL